MRAVHPLLEMRRGPRLSSAIWLSVLEAACALHVSEWTVRRWAHNGRLRSARPGHRLLIAREDVERLTTLPHADVTPVARKESGFADS